MYLDDENGVEYSKNQIKKMKAQIKKERKQAEKEAAKKLKEANKPKKEKKKKLIEDDISDPAKYYENRVKVINKLNEDKTSDYAPFPHKWVNTHYVNKLVEEFDAKEIENGSFDESAEVSTAGRVETIRELAAGLIFYDIVAEGSKI